MSDYRSETLGTYNKEAIDIAKKFSHIDRRDEDVIRAFSLLDIGTKNPFVLELGCGNGRDAEIVLDYTSNYIGVDYSEKMIEIASLHVPEANFVVSDIETYPFPSNLDLIIAFASLLHIEKENIKIVFNKAYKSLKKGGIFYISTKEGEYRKERETKVHGPRTFFYYDLVLIKELTKKHFEIVYEDKQLFRNKNWITVALRRI